MINILLVVRAVQRRHIEANGAFCVPLKRLPAPTARISQFNTSHKNCCRPWPLCTSWGRFFSFFGGGMNVTKLHKCGNLEKPPHTAIVSMLVLPTWGIWAGVCWGVVLNVSKLCVNLPLRPFSLHCLFRLPPSPLPVSI